MIRQPPEVTAELVAQASLEVAETKQLPAARELRLERFAEGLTAQIMHVGHYATEAPTIERLHAFIAEHGYARRGKHHEIYLSDPRRTAPARLKTIIRATSDSDAENGGSSSAARRRRRQVGRARLRTRRPAEAGRALPSDAARTGRTGRATRAMRRCGATRATTAELA
jgi:hypothetical protein